MSITNAEITSLMNRIKRFAERNGAAQYVGLRRVIRHLGRATQSGNAARAICLALARREFHAFVAQIEQRKGSLV